MKPLRPLLGLVFVVVVCPVFVSGQASGKTGAKPPAPAAPKGAAAPDTTVIRGGKLLTITHGVIENGVVVLDHGKITAVGAAASVAVPREAKGIAAPRQPGHPRRIGSQTPPRTPPDFPAVI